MLRRSEGHRAQSHWGPHTSPLCHHPGAARVLWWDFQGGILQGRIFPYSVVLATGGVPCDEANNKPRFFLSHDCHS